MDRIHFHNNVVDLNTIWYQSHKDLVEKIAIELGSAEKIELLLQKFLGPATKFKKQKAPNAPKRPKSAFMYFCNKERSQIKDKYPDLKLGGIQKELGKLWQSLGADDKKKYELQNNEDKVRYEMELEEYNLNKNLF